MGVGGEMSEPVAVEAKCSGVCGSGHGSFDLAIVVEIFRVS